jgi:hypothetical protein
LVAVHVLRAASRSRAWWRRTCSGQQEEVLVAAHWLRAAGGGFCGGALAKCSRSSF